MHGKTQQREEKAQARTPVSTGKSASAGHSVMQRSPVDFDPLSAVESETGRNRASSASNAPPLPARPKKLTSSGTILQEAAVGKWKVVEKMCEQRRVSRGITVAIHSLALLKQKNYVKARQKAKELGGGICPTSEPCDKFRREPVKIEPWVPVRRAYGVLQEVWLV